MPKLNSYLLTAGIIVSSIPGYVKTAAHFAIFDINGAKLAQSGCFY